MRVRYHIPEEGLYWLECTAEEAAKNIYPLMTEEQIATSRDHIGYVSRRWEISDEEDEDSPPKDIYSRKKIKYPACFIVDGHFSKVEPAPATLPFLALWNGDSPYRLMEEFTFDNMSDFVSRYRE